MDIKEIKQLLNALESSDIDRLEVKDKDFELVLEKHQEPQRQPAAVQKEHLPLATISKENAVANNVSLKTAVAQEEDFYKVTSPIVGTFYASAAPGEPSFVEVGDQVVKGQVVCIIEAMKLMNELKSDIDGIVQSILVSDEDGVDYGQSLMTIKPLV